LQTLKQKRIYNINNLRKINSQITTSNLQSKLKAKLCKSKSPNNNKLILLSSEDNPSTSVNINPYTRKFNFNKANNTKTESSFDQKTSNISNNLNKNIINKVKSKNSSIVSNMIRKTNINIINHIIPLEKPNSEDSNKLSESVNLQAKRFNLKLNLDINTYNLNNFNTSKDVVNESGIKLIGLKPKGLSIRTLSDNDINNKICNNLTLNTNTAKSRIEFPITSDSSIIHKNTKDSNYTGFSAAKENNTLKARISLSNLKNRNCKLVDKNKTNNQLIKSVKNKLSLDNNNSASTANSVQSQLINFACCSIDNSTNVIDKLCSFATTHGLELKEVTHFIIKLRFLTGSMKLTKRITRLC